MERNIRETHGSQTHQTCLCSLDLHHISRSASHTPRWHSETPRQCSLPGGWAGTGRRRRRSAPAPRPNCRSSRGLRRSSTWAAHTPRCYSGGGWAHRSEGRYTWARRCRRHSRRHRHTRSWWPSTCGWHTWTHRWGRLWHLEDQQKGTKLRKLTVPTLKQERCDIYFEFTVLSKMLP